METAGGRSVLGPSSFEITDCMAGNWMVPRGSCPLQISASADSCETCLCVIERMMTNLSACFAVNGRRSEMRMPETLVSMGANWLRYLESTSGLGSQLSIWLMPPLSKIGRAHV